MINYKRRIEIHDNKVEMKTYPKVTHYVNFHCSDNKVVRRVQKFIAISYTCIVYQNGYL